MQVPNDIGQPWRWNKLVEFCINGDQDYTFATLCTLANNMELTIEQRVWMSFLYSACYCTPTTYIIFKRFPYQNKISRESIDRFWGEYKTGLVFNSDRRYVKNLNQFPDMAWDFIQICRGSCTKYIERFQSHNPPTFYKNMCEEIIKNWKGFGPMSSILFTEALYKLTPYKLDTNVFNWQKGLTSTEGMLHALYMDEEALSFQKGKRKLGVIERVKLDRGLKKLQLDFKEKTGKRLTLYDAETAMCFYRKLFKCHKYVGSSIDTQHLQLNLMTHAICNKCIPQVYWDKLFEVRKLVFRNDLVGELNGRHARLDTKLYHRFMDEGITGAEDGPSVLIPYTYKETHI